MEPDPRVFESDEDVGVIIAALVPHLRRLAKSGHNWKVVVSGSTTGEVKAEVSEFALLTKKQQHRCITQR